MFRSITDYGPTPFRFYNSWIEIDGFKELVEDSWRDAPVDNCNGMRTFMFKLKFLKNKIKEWNSRFLKNSKADLTHLQEELKQIDAEIDCGKGNDSIVAQRLDVMNSINNIVKIYDSQALQKAKIKWAIEGDENSRFFHGIINKRRKQRSIRGVMKDGVWLDKPEDVKYEFLSYFRDRFTHSDGIRVPIDMEFPNSISSSQQVELESDVTTAEIKRAVWDCGVDKSPGPDDFTFCFYRRFWDMLEKDVVLAVKQFFTDGVFPSGCNSSFIALIPKISNANMVKDFRPISLIGSLYKIITKILANRLVPVLGDLVIPPSMFWDTIHPLD
ncbi:hypothetical protein Tco_0727277 [Tanacetum coccineum]|uniref:RNA-directed DNA polymerase, eukaryota n=1 Tax=Tanacetum coccineum TaxID=301880 RepID=A0ABQ4YIY0_9ASTR